MDLRQLRYFVAIFESGTLSNAADNLRIAASALSHHLANLESELGVKLFYRKPRGMAPTAAGHRLHEHAKLILKTLAAAEADLREAGGEISGDVSIGMAYSAVKAIGVDLARRVLQDFPRLELALTESLSGTTLMNLLASDVDIALVYNPPLDPSLRTQPILEERMVLVGKREIIGEDKGPITFEELLKLPIILLRQGVSARAILDDINLLKKKLFMQDQLAKGTVHFRPIVEPELSRTLYMCELTSRPPTFALEAVRNLALELIEEAVNDGRWEAKLVLKKRRNLRQPDRRGT